MRNHLSETIMLNDIQITSDYMSRWVVLKRRVGAVTSQRVIKVLFYVNILREVCLDKIIKLYNIIKLKHKQSKERTENKNKKAL